MPMSKRKIRFILNGVSLFEDKTLKEKDGFPELFICKDMFSFYYVVLCTNKESKEYIIIKPSLIDVYKLIHNQIDINTLIKSCDVFWKIIECDEEDYHKDVVSCLSINEINKYLKEKE